ncbi:hypothetical protein B0A49_04381 [Cryomyces minteri]|uniref:Uncharacterized protein n=1 Tax=Cryomyces minteri TaxID=331657 RepID=A0A4U0X4Q8_9PEZI|nr:hypothetical protein B0A49_04381 [Cryomyces minteri]
MPFTGSDIIKIILAIFLPPVGVFLERGCGADLLINILLTCLGYIPGIIHALYVNSDHLAPDLNLLMQQQAAWVNATPTLRPELRGVSNNDERIRLASMDLVGMLPPELLAVFDADEGSFAASSAAYETARRQVLELAGEDAFDQSLRLKRTLDEEERLAEYYLRNHNHLASVPDDLREPLQRASSRILRCEYHLYMLNSNTPLKYNPFLSHWVEIVRGWDRKVGELQGQHSLNTELLFPLRTRRDFVVLILQGIPFKLINDRLSDQSLSADEASGFVRTYIQHSLRDTERRSKNVPTDDETTTADTPYTDPDSQTRALKLLVLFVKNLIRKSIVAPEQIYYEIQEICVRYIWVKEVRDFRNFMETGV